MVVVFGNVLVILSACQEKLLQNITNFLIVSLPVADLLVAGFVMPFSVYVLVRQHRQIDSGFRGTFWNWGFLYDPLREAVWQYVASLMSPILIPLYHWAL